MSPINPAPVATVDEQNPWLGLVSFTEETRGYFHGREEEVAELGRRVQRKLLTILFGQSGLGKTSILQAGLVPRLRPEGFCPVYVRLDYDPSSPSPSEQIKRAVFRATEAAGTWTRVGSSTAGETLWEFLHHRDDVLKDAAGRTLTPILIFDQFEEIFTLAQSDEAGRKRAHEFLADLSDLVENRPPAALEARIDRDEADAAGFDFARADYRILISLREDYLAHLEGLKAQMPSVTQNRMRLARMSGPQAVAAVCAPAPHLVTETVAEAIVRFVAGASDLSVAEVEPSLLSLICRELNNARLSRGQAEISADLLAGSRDTILSEFYERALADQPAGVRVFVEDEMLTDSGFRESVAEERVAKGFAAAGAAPEALATLVNRRLLRVEDRLDLRRVEITHDVLCSVIAASRQVRREREALEESKRQLEAQREREAATRRSLVRARTIAAVSAVLMVIAAGSAVFGWINLRRAREAEVQTQAARQLAEQARSESENLAGFLLDQFYEELQPTGRVEIVENLADKAVSYYDSLPQELVTRKTKVNHGMALIRKASAMSDGGDAAGAVKVANEAGDIFEQLRAAGDLSEETALGLALARFTRSNASYANESVKDFKEAVGLLKPFVVAGSASRATKLALADTYNFLCHMVPLEEGNQDCIDGRKILADMGALDLSDLTAASIYGDVADSQARILLSLKEPEEAGKLERSVYEIAERVLIKRPGDLRAMKDVYFARELLAEVAESAEDLVEAESEYRAAIQAAHTYSQFNPADARSLYLYSQSVVSLSWVLYEEGRISDSVDSFQALVAMESAIPDKSASDDGYFVALRSLAIIESQLGHGAEADDWRAKAAKEGVDFDKALGTDAAFNALTAIDDLVVQCALAGARGDFAHEYELASRARAQFATLKQQSEMTRFFYGQIVRTNNAQFIESCLRTGRYGEAEAVARDMMEHPFEIRGDTRRAAQLEGRNKVQLGRALVELGRKADARAPLDAIVALYRARRARGADGTTFRLDFAAALYQLSRAQDDDEAGKAKRNALLGEAAGVLFGLSAEAQDLVASKELTQWVGAARAQVGN